MKARKYRATAGRLHKNNEAFQNFSFLARATADLATQRDPKRTKE